MVLAIFCFSQLIYPATRLMHPLLPNRPVTLLIFTINKRVGTIYVYDSKLNEALKQCNIHLQVQYDWNRSMDTLIFQVHTQQWDKSQRSADHVAKRAAIPRSYPVVTKAKYSILKRDCIIDQHGTDSARKLATALLADGSVTLERFVIKQKDQQLILSYEDENKQSTMIGDLNNGWIQARYQWRKRVEQDGLIFWLYEELTLNAACIEVLDPKDIEDCFLACPALFTFNALL